MSKDKKEKEVEFKKTAEEFNRFITDATDRIICTYLCTFSRYSIADVFKNISAAGTEFTISGRKHNYTLKFIITDFKSYDLKMPPDVSKIDYDKILNEMDNLIRSDIVMRKRYPEYLAYQLSKAKVPAFELIEGGKIFLHEQKVLYYLGNAHMDTKHIAFVNATKLHPYMIGLDIKKQDETG